MKKIIGSIALLSTLCSMGCSDSFLDKSPELQVSESLIFSSATRLEAGVTGVYSRAKDGYFLGGYTIVAGDNRSDDMIN